MNDTMLTSRVEEKQGGNGGVHMVLDHGSMKRILRRVIGFDNAQCKTRSL
jgi:hypothetical protein